MIPVYEQGGGRSIGLTARSFRQRFDSVCEEHLVKGKAEAFSFIFYDFTNSQLRSLLQDQGVFTKLDRLAGKKLSIFHLHDGGRRSVEQFNEEFIRRLGIEEQVTLPSIVFFKLKDGHIEDIVVAPLESATLRHGLHELYSLIERYISEELASGPPPPEPPRWLKSAGKFVGVEIFRNLLREVFPHLM
jgi:hypothetical protein